jgi:hypothetical protein
LAAPTAAAASAGDWTDIVTKNIFSFDRNDIDIVPPKPVETAASLAAAQAAAAPPVQKPILYGTISIGNLQQASLASGKAPNLASHAMKVGETIDGWQLVEIRSNSVVVTAGAVRETILTNNAPAVQRSSERTDTPSETIAVAPASPPPSPTAATPAANPVDPFAAGCKGHVVRSPIGGGAVCVPDN